MNGRSRSRHHRSKLHLLIGTLACMSVLAPLDRAASQTPTPAAADRGSVGGRVTDEQGAPVVGAQVYAEGTSAGTISAGDGNYTLSAVPAGTHVIRARLIGFRPESASVAVTAGQ